MLSFSTNVGALAQVIAQASRAVASNAMQPALTGVFISSGEEALIVQATDQQMGLQVNVPAHIHDGGAVLLPAKQLSELLRRISPQETVHVKEHGSVIELSFKRASFELPALNARDFPSLEFGAKDQGQIMDATALQELLGLVSYAVATRDDSIPVLQGIQLSLEESGMLSACASDNFRLAYAERKVAQEAQPQQVVVRGKSLLDMLRLTAEGDVLVQVEPRRALFHASHMDAFVQRIEGAFPDHRTLVRHEYPMKAVFDTDTLLTAVERASLLSPPHAPQVILSLNQEGIGIRVSSADLGRGSDFVEAEVEGEDLEIGFNPRFLIEALRALPGENGEAHFTGPESAALLKTSADVSFLALVLPVKIL